MAEKQNDQQADAGTTLEGDGQRFGIQRIYIKDVSFEAPDTPKSFLNEYSPEIKVDLEIQHVSLDDIHTNVVLHLTVTAEQEDKTVFLVEVQQAGVFSLKGFDDTTMGQILAVVCPNVLFPYAREAISDLVVKGGFPPLYLAPVNFEAMYAAQAGQFTQKAANEPVAKTEGSKN